MTDIVERLRRYKRDRSGYAEYCHQAADEIESLEAEIDRLKAKRDAWENACSHWEDEAIASQAREAKLRELLTQFELCESYDDPETPIKDALARIGSDDTALQQAIKQGQREAAEHILEMWRDPWPRTERSFIDRLEAYRDELRKMAEEL
jgi:chromosome segregation ATPase